MMLRFQWDSLHRGDHILVHDVRTADLGLRPAIVELVDSSGSRRDIAAATPTGPTPDFSCAPAASRPIPTPHRRRRLLAVRRSLGRLNRTPISRRRDLPCEQRHRSGDQI